MTNLPTALTFITTEATASDLDRVIDAVNTRRKFFRSARAATVYVGAEVELTNLSPKALNGLTGEVKSITKDRCDVLLTEGATVVLASSRTKFAMAAGVAMRDTAKPQYLIHGVPLSSCEIQS